MDANGTKFHLLLGEGDWGRAAKGGLSLTQPPSAAELLADLWQQSTKNGKPVDLRWDKARNELTLATQIFQFTPSHKDEPPKLSNRRGAARDRFGNWYWIAADEKEILVNSSGSGATSHFWSSDDPQGCEIEPEYGGFAPLDKTQAARDLRLRGLTVTEDHYLVVGVIEPAGLLIFDLYAGGGPLQKFWPKELSFSPFDFTARPGGGVWILDRDFEDPLKPARLWALDRYFNVEKRNQPEETLNGASQELFQPVAGEPRTVPPRMFPRGITLEHASPLAMLDPIAIEALPDQTVLILDRNERGLFSLVFRYGFEGQIGTPSSTEKMIDLVEQSERASFTLIAHDFALVPEHVEKGITVPDLLYVVEQKGNQSFAFNISQKDGQIDLEPLAAYLPMRLFGGKGLVTGGSQAYYDFGDRWIPLVEQPRPRYAPSAIIVTPIFDGAEPDCQWHRLMLDGCIPPESKVEIWSRAADSEEELKLTEWYAEPKLYHRGDGSELPYASIQGAEKRGSASDYGTWELLFQRAHGRFIQLRLRLSGDGRTTPRLRAVRMYYPRFSYLKNYLPAIYREEEQPASFLDRFLANVEGFYTSIEDKIAAVQMLFDVRSVPREYLDWLASWFGVVLDPVWNDAKRRLFIRHAIEFFQYRGTIHGLKIALRLALESCADGSVFDMQRSLDPRRDSIRIVESFRTRRIQRVALGDPTNVRPMSGIGTIELEPTIKWQPRYGRADLYDRYSRFLRDRFGADQLAAVAFPLSSPEWQKPSLSSAIGQIPLFESIDTQLWRAFLKKRYSTISALNTTYGTTYGSFESIAPPPSMDPGSAVLIDWSTFLIEKTGAWRDFSEMTLGFVPQAAVRERELWRAFLTSRYESVTDLNNVYHSHFDQIERVPLPANVPGEGGPDKDWDDFKKMTAGTSASTMRRRWQEFLARRYRRIGALNDSYDTQWIGFDDVALFDELPLRQSALMDWYLFESVVLAMQSTAHRFTVLLPVPKNRRSGDAELQRRRELATRIVNWEKPAHTVFDVKFYWAMFRVSEARLGYDTLLDVGSRAPALLNPMVLSQGYLAESYLQDCRSPLTNRQMIGGARLEKRRKPEIVLEH